MAESMTDIVDTLRALTKSTGRDHRTGMEFVHGYDSQTVVDAIRAAEAEIILLREAKTETAVSHVRTPHDQHD